MRKLVVELMGTFFFVLTIILTNNPWAIASMLMAWAYIGGYVSGAHYNPAVSLAVGLSHRWNWLEIIKYMIAQTLGAFIAMQASLFLTGKNGLSVINITGTMSHLLTMEALLTFVFTYVVLVVATTLCYKESKLFGFAIGFTIPALFALGGPISGAIFNPAIIFGSALSVLIGGGSLTIYSLMVYILAQCLGAILAACSFKYINLDQ